MDFSEKINDAGSQEINETSSQAEKTEKEKQGSGSVNVDKAKNVGEETANTKEEGEKASLSTKVENNETDKAAECEGDVKENENLEETNNDDSEEYESAETTEEDASKSESPEVPAIKEEGRLLWPWLL